MKKEIHKKLTALLTVLFLGLNQLVITPQASANPFSLETKLPSADFKLDLPPELGTIQALISGPGPVLIQIQTAHGNYEAQKKIQAILHHLKKQYGIDLLLLEGSASKLNPELLDFFGGRKNLNMKMAEALTRQALVKGDELFLIEEPKTQAYGIENIPAYRRNREAFKAVLTQREKTEKFVEGMNMQIKRLTAPYLSRDLKTFLNRAEDFEGNQISGLSHFIYLKEMAKKNLELDLTDPANQIDWPMLLRLYKLAELESRIDLRAFEKERAAFLRKIRWISPDVFAEIQKLLSSPLSKHRLPDPGTGILFEKMVAALPADFDYQPYPNVQRFMGHLILQSEIKEDRLAEETEQLTDKIAQKLAKTKEEKNILSLFNDYKLLKKLFALELTPKDYETILERRKDLAAGKIIKRFLDLNHDRRVKNVQFVHVGDINILFKKAMRFYRGTKERDRWMLQNILDRLKGNKARKAVVITGGFHAGPFKNFFQKQGFNYALIAPKITSAEGREAYLQAALQDSELPLKKSTMELSRRSETRAIQAALGENLDWIDGRIDLARSEILRQAGKTFQRESLRGPALRSETRAETPSLAVSGNFPLNFKNALSGTVTPEHGITPEGLTALVPELVKAHRQIQEWRQGEKSPLNRLNYEFGDSYYQEMRALGILWKDESDDIVILGGTASGAEMAFRALVHEKWNDLPKEKRNGYPRIHFVSPDKAGKFLNGLNLQKTRIVIIGDDLDQDPYLKLGYQTVKQKLAEALGAENVLKRIAIVTDLVTPDVLSADAANAVQKFRIPFDLSLKNSFFTAAGLLPLMLAGKDNEVAMLRKGAREAQKTIDSLNAKISSSQSFVLEYSDYLRPALVYFLYTQKHKNIAIFHVFSEKLRQFGTWRANRLNDLMGRTRQTLIFRGSVGTRHNHAELQDWQKGANHFQVTTLGIEEFSHSTPAGPTSWPLFQGVPLGDLLNASRLGTEEGLAHGKRPNMNISIPRVDAENLGRLIYSAFYEDAVLRGLLVGELEKRDPVRSEARQNGILKDDTGIDFTYSLPRALTEFEQANFDDDLETIMLEVAGERLSNKHDFLNLPEHMIERIQTSDFRDPISRLKKDKSKFIIIGIGGSSQGAKMEFENLGISTENLIFLEGIDPDYTEELLEGIDLTEAGVMVISKSGETLESNVILSLVRQKMVEAFRQKGKTWNPQDSIVAVTDPAVGILRKEATRFGYGLLEVPPLVDGRFSVLSDVGIAVMSLVMEEGQILEFLKGAQDYVERTELSLSLLKDLEEEKDREETRPKDDRRLEHLNREVRTELKRKSAAAIGYQYGGWSSFWTIAEKKGLWLDIALSGDFGEMIEEMIQLWNESIGKPAVDEEGHSILYYRRGVVAPQELRLNSSLLNHPDQAITLWNLKRDDDPAQDHLQQAIRADIQNKLKFSPTPIFGYDIPRNLRALGALTVMKQQSVVVHSKTKLLGKPMEYSGQPGVEDSKRRARKSIQDKKGVSIDVIPQELAPLGDFVRSVGLLVSTELANVNFEDPQARENAVALLIRKAIEENQGPAAIKSVWMRDQEKPEMINDKGTKTMAVVPLDKSSVVDMSNGTIGSLFAVYKGDELTPENLEATFILLYGPTTVMIARVVPDGEAQVYDFIWSEEHHEFVQKQHAGRETSLIELTKKGDEIAFNGRLQDWPDYLEKFYYAEIKRRGKKVRISETVADLYEMLLKGGLVAVALTDVEAVMWGSVMEGAGGRSLVMTPEGPQSAMTLKLGAESFQTDKKHWAFFGNKEVMDRLEAAMKESRDNPEYKPPVWHGQIREQNDNKLLTEALAEMGEDSEIINIMQASAATAIEVVRPMFSKIGIEEGGGSVNSAGDEQVGADQATNTAFRNGLFNPKRDPALELELVNAEASNLKVPSDKLPDALISAFFSEEEARGYGGNPNAKYSVIFDPLDGSSKVDTNGGVSTIGGIWKSKRATPPSADLPKSDDPVFVNYLQGRTGREGLHGSFFFLYGPQTLLYYTSEKTKKVHVFRLDPLKKEFRRIGVLGEAPKGPPKVGLRLAIGGERPDMVPEGLSDSLTTFEKKHNGRAAYAGSLNADGVGIFNGNDPLADGGGYIYPGTKRRPEGRLRLDSEEAPLALIMEKIGGRASNGRQNILDIPIQKLHQHEPLFIGTEWFVDQIDAIHARSETRTKKQVEAIDVVDLETRGKALIDFLKTHLSGRNNNAHPFTFEDLQKLREWYASPTVPEEERAAFNHHITSILFGGRSLIVPASNEASAEGHKIHVIGGPSLLDLDIRFEDEGEGNPLRLVYAQARRGGAAKLTAPFGVESRFFGLTGAKSTLESRLLRELSARGVKGQGKTIHIPGVSRTNIFFSDKDGKHTIDLKLRPPVLDRETAARLLKEIDENFPPTRDRELVILAGSIFGYGTLGGKLVEMLEARGYRTLFDFKPYQTSAEIHRALKRRPFAVKLNLEEFISLINPDLKKDDLKRDPELVIQLAAHQLAIPYDIPLFVVSLEDGGAVAIYQTDGVIRRTLNDSVQWLLEHARFFKRIIRWFYNLLSPPKWRAISLKAPSVAITNTIGAGDAFVGSLAVTLSEQPEWTFNDEWVRKAVAGAVAAGTIALTKPVTEVGSQEEIASLLTELKETVQNVAITHPKRQRKEKQNDHDIETPRIRDVVSALLRKDPSIWPLSNQDDIVKWLGWFDAPEKYADPEALMQIESLRDRIAAEGFEHIVLVGTGGSALGADTIYRILPSTGKGVHDLTVLSLTHPRAIQRIQKHIQSNLDKTLFIIGTKSGQTLDTVLAYRYLRKWLTNRLGGDFTQRKVSQQIVVITDPGKTIDAEPPRDVDFRKVFINDPAIGGRFSVFSYFGIVPAGLAGVDVRGFLDSARQERSALIRIAHGMDPADNRVFALYPMLMQEFNEGRNKFTFIIPEEWQAFGAWLEQLLNESIPKKQMVPIAVTGEAQLSANHYDEDRVFIRLELGSTGKPFRRTSRGLPEIVFPVADSDQLGALMFDWMVLTALLGHSLKIHPFNQPGVALSKTLTEQALAGGLKEEKPMTEFQGGAIKISLDTASQVLLESRGVKLNGPNTTAQQVISGFLATMPAKTYAAVLAYEDEGVTGILSRIRRRIQRSYHVATLQGVGPNFEHSLNQLLTAAEGTVIMLTFDPPEEDPQAGGLLSVSELIPNESFTFDGLTMAKASGNLATLMDLGRPVMHIHLSRDYFNHPRDIARLFSKVPSRSETRTVDEKESEPEMDASLFSERPMEIVTPVSSPEVFYRWLYNPGGFANEGSARSEYFLPVEIQQMSGDAYRLDLLNQWTNDFQMDRALWAVLSDPEKNFHAMKEKIWALHNITNGTMEVAFSQQAGFVADEPQFKSKVQKSVDLFFDILNFNEKSLSLIAWKMIAGASFLKNMRIEGDPLQWVADHYQNMSSPFDFSPSDDIDPGNLDRVLQLTLAKTILHEIKQRLGGVSLEQAMIELNTDFTLTSRKFGPASPAALFKTFIDTEGRFHFYSYPQAIEKLADDQWETHSRGPDNGPSIPKLALMVTQPKPGALPPRLYAALPMFEGVLFGAFAHNPQGTLQLRFPNRDSRAAFQQHFELASDEAVTEQALLHQYVDLIRFLAGEHGISRAKKLIVPEDVRDLFKKHFGINIPGDEANQPRIQEFLKITENIRQSPPVSLPLIGKEVLQNQATRPLSDDEELEITLRYHDMIWALFQPQQMKALSHEGRNFFLWKTIIIPDDIRHFFVKHFQVRLPGSQDDPPSIGDYFNATSNKGIYPLPDLMQLWHNHPQRLARPERPVDSKKAARSETRDLTSPVITPEIKTLFDGARQQVLPLRLEEELEAAKLVEILIELLQRPVYSEKAGILPPVLESRMAQALGDGRASPAAGFESWVNATSSEEGRVLLDPVWLTKLIEKSPYTLYVVLSALQKFQQNRKVTEPLIAVPGEESDLFRKIEQAMLDKKSNLNWNEKDKVRRLLIPQLKQLIQVVADQELNHYIESHNYGVATLLSGRSETRWGGLMAGLPLGARFTADSSQVHDNDLVMIAFLVPALLKAAALVRGITNNPGEQTRLLEPLIWQIIPGARSEARGFVIQSLRYLQQLINQKSVEVSA